MVMSAYEELDKIYNFSEVLPSVGHIEQIKRKELTESDKAVLFLLDEIAELPIQYVDIKVDVDNEVL